MTGGGAGCGVTEKARWNRAVRGGVHRGRRSGMGRIAKSPTAGRHKDQAVKMNKSNFVSNLPRISWEERKQGFRHRIHTGSDACLLASSRSGAAGKSR